MPVRDLDELHQIYSDDEILARVCLRLGIPLNTPSMKVFIVARQRYHEYTDHSYMPRACEEYGEFCENRRVPVCVGSWAI